MSATTSAPAAMNAGGVQLREIGTPETRYDVDPLVGKILWDLERTANTSQLEDFDCILAACWDYDHKRGKDVWWFAVKYTDDDPVWQTAGTILDHAGDRVSPVHVFLANLHPACVRATGEYFHTDTLYPTRAYTLDAIQGAAALVKNRDPEAMRVWLDAHKLYPNPKPEPWAGILGPGSPGARTMRLPEESLVVTDAMVQAQYAQLCRGKLPHCFDPPAAEGGGD